MAMTPDRARDAAKLRGQIPAAQWVEMFGEDLVNGYLAAIDPTSADNRSRRGRLALTATAGSLMNRTIATALEAFEIAIGGTAEKGRRFLTSKGGSKVKATPVRMAAAVVLYSAVRRAALAFLAHGAKPEGDQATSAADQALAAVAALEQAPMPDGVAEDQRERIQDLFGQVKRSVTALHDVKPKTGPDAVN